MNSIDATKYESGDKSLSGYREDCKGQRHVWKSLCTTGVDRKKS